MSPFAQHSVRTTMDDRRPRALRSYAGTARDGEPRFENISARLPRAHLTKSQVRKLWDAGSFLIQEYGILLNSRIMIGHERLSTAPMRDGAELVSDLVHELGMA